MNWGNFLRGLTLTTLIFGGILLVLTLTLSPEKGPIIIGLYFLAIFFFIFGITAIISFLIRRWWQHNELMFENVKTSIRQASLFSSFLLSLLALSAMRLLTWWDGAILLVSFFLVEMYFKTRS